MRHWYARKFTSTSSRGSTPSSASLRGKGRGPSGLCKIVAVSRPGKLQKRGTTEGDTERHHPHRDICSPYRTPTSTKRIGDGKSIKYLLPDQVEQYIYKKDCLKTGGRWRPDVMKFTKFVVILLLAVVAASAGLSVHYFVDPKPQTGTPSPSSESGSSTSSSSASTTSAAGSGLTLWLRDGGHRQQNRASHVHSQGHAGPDSGRGWDKIGHAYAYGKMPLLRETVVNYLGQPVNYYVLVNYETFPSVIDLLGGIEIDVERRMVYNDYAGKLFINIPKGRQVLDGKNALHYVRFRHDALGDIGRVERQQKFVKAVLNKVQSQAIIPKIRNSCKGHRDGPVRHDARPGVAARLVPQGLLPGELSFFTLQKAAYISNLSYWIGDITAASQLATVPEETTEEVASADSSPSPRNSRRISGLLSSMTMPVTI